MLHDFGLTFGESEKLRVNWCQYTITKLLSPCGDDDSPERGTDAIKISV